MKQQVALIQQQQAVTGKSRTTIEKEKEQALRAKEKLEEEKRKKEEAALLRPVQTQKVPFGVDPKTVLCAFYKAGHCEKGNKCKFSHDLNVERKVEKKNLYADSREEKLADTMDKWDQEKLAQVVLSKAGNPRTTTDVCLASLFTHIISCFSRLCASSSYRPLKTKSTSIVIAPALSADEASPQGSDGSGSAPTARLANTGMPCPQALFLNPSARLSKRPTKPKL